MTTDAQKKATKKWNSTTGHENYITFRIYRELNDTVKSMSLKHDLTPNEYIALIVSNYHQYIQMKDDE